MSESLNMQQLKNLKEVARQLGATGMTASQSTAVTDTSFTLSVQAEDVMLSYPTPTHEFRAETDLDPIHYNMNNGVGAIISPQSLSNDGRLMVVGFPNHSSSHFHVYEKLYNRNSHNFNLIYTSQSIITLNNSKFGSSIAMNKDGSLIAVGAPEYSSTNRGLIKIYKREGNRFTEASMLGGGAASIMGDSGYLYFGHSLAMSADGSTLIIGCPQTNQAHPGIVYVYKEIAGTWTRQNCFAALSHNPNGDYLMGSNNGGLLGWSVSVSADGKTFAVVSKRHDSTNKGAVHVYTFNDNTDKYELVGSRIDGWENDKEVNHCSLSADGTIVALSSKDSQGGTGYAAGKVKVLELSDGQWVSRADITGIVTYSVGEEFGSSISLSADGNILSIGARYNRTAHPYGGKVYLYERVGNTYSLKFDIDTHEQNSQFGRQLSMNLDGTELLVGYADVNSYCWMRMYTIGNLVYPSQSQSLQYAIDGLVSKTDPLSDGLSLIKKMPNLDGVLTIPSLYLSQRIWNDNNSILRSVSGSYINTQGYGTWNSGVSGHANFGMSLYTEESIMCKETIYVYSDRRIKKNIEDVPDALALEQVRKIPCRYYEYKDQVKRGSEKTIGFIAQEVNEVLPMAVNRMTDFIPDHMKMAELSWEESKLMTVSNLNEDVTTGTKIRFKCYTGTLPTFNEDGSIKTPSINLLESTEDVVMMEGGKFKMKEKYDHVFIFGREVDDKLALDKNKIFALHHSAIQELDRTVEAQKATIAAQESALAALEQKNAAQESALAALLARVEALEGN